MIEMCANTCDMRNIGVTKVATWGNLCLGKVLNCNHHTWLLLAITKTP